MEQEKDWYFTFGTEHRPFHKNYVKIHGTVESTRLRMFDLFDNRWCMQYDEKKGREVVRRWEYQELDISKASLNCPFCKERTKWVHYSGNDWTGEKGQWGCFNKNCKIKPKTRDFHISTFSDQLTEEETSYLALNEWIQSFV